MALSQNWSQVFQVSYHNTTYYPNFLSQRLTRVAPVALLNSMNLTFVEDIRVASRAAACKMFWDSLPVEIQIHILEDLVLHENSARYASICQAWQTIIERRIFACLKVTRSRLADFSDIGYRHRHLVKYI